MPRSKKLTKKDIQFLLLLNKMNGGIADFRKGYEIDLVTGLPFDYKKKDIEQLDYYYKERNKFIQHIDKLLNNKFINNKEYIHIKKNIENEFNPQIERLEMFINNPSNY